MKTIIYIELMRNRKKWLHDIICITLIPAVIFVLSIIIDHLTPVVNTVLNIPDAFRDFFALYAWQGQLYSNIFNIFAIIYPFIFTYTLMSSYYTSIIDEEQYETVIYMRNLGISRGDMQLAKLFVGLTKALSICIVILLENTIFFLILKNHTMLRISCIYCFELFAIGVIYMSIAMFISSYSINKDNCETISLAIILIPFIFARIHALLKLFTDLQVNSGKRVLKLDIILNAISKLKALQLLSPVIWCFPGQKTSGAYGICALVLIIILTITGYSIYTRNTIIYRSE